MTPEGRRQLVATLCLISIVGCRHEPARQSWLSAAENVAPGVELYRSADESLVEGTGPVSVYLLRLDPSRVRLSSVLSNDEVADAEPVPDIAVRHRAIAAVNGGFFNGTNGEPTGVLKVAGELVSDASASKGAVIIESRPGTSTTLTFDRLSVKMAMTVTAGGEEWKIPIDGVDTTRVRGRLMLYTPAYHADTDTA